ncbi:MAG: hypothetical protein Sapg2KO_07600 [Saprospiraceae bacterium]
MESIKSELINWDGKSTFILQDIYNKNCQNPNFIQILTDWSIQDVKLQNASTWLLKHYVDKKNTLTRSQTVALLPALSVAKAWPAQLHLLQMLPLLPLTEADLEILLNPIERLMQDKVKFVKAWAYYAFALMTQFVPELRPEVEQIFQIGIENESAAIKARIRRACKDFQLQID